MTYSDDRYPNREHYSAHLNEQRKALAAIQDIQRSCTELDTLVMKAIDPDDVQVYGAKVCSMEDNVRRLGAALEALHVLYEVRQWHKVDKMEQDQHMVSLVTGEADDGTTETQVFMVNKETGGETYVGAVRDEDDYLTWRPSDTTMAKGVK